MGIVDGFKKIGGGGKKVGRGMLKVGRGALKVIDVAGDVANHPAVAALTVFVPYAWIPKALTAVRRVNKIADDLRDEFGTEMSDEQKKQAFAEMIRKDHPEATDSDIDLLAVAMVKFEKGDTTDGEDD